MDTQNELSAPGTRAASFGSTAFVRADALQRFTELVAQLGGDAEALLSSVGIDPSVLANRHAVVPYPSFVQLLKRACVELSCPDFGMRLAAIQDVARVLGPLEVAMRHCATLRAAFEYCSANIQVCSIATQIFVEEDAAQETTFLRLHVEVPESLLDPQAVEHALLLTQHNILELSGRRIRAREIWFRHAPIAALSSYETYFGTTVRFGQALNAAVLPRDALDSEIPGADPQLHALASYFIDAHYPRSEVELSARVNALIEPLLREGRCTQAGMAEKLGLDPRELRLQLKAEGASFETIRDRVRRDLAARYLTQSDLPLVRIAALLGYADTAVLTKSCQRWFGVSPRQLRKGGGEAAG